MRLITRGFHRYLAENTAVHKPERLRRFDFCRYEHHHRRSSRLRRQIPRREKGRRRTPRGRYYSRCLESTSRRRSFGRRISTIIIREIRTTRTSPRTLSLGRSSDIGRRRSGDRLTEDRLIGDTILIRGAITVTARDIRAIIITRERRWWRIFRLIGTLANITIALVVNEPSTVSRDTDNTKHR